MPVQTPLLTDSELENLKTALRDPQTRGWSANQQIMGFQVYEADKALRADTREEFIRTNRAERLTAAFTGGVYRGAAQVLGAPVDALNFGLRTVAPNVFNRRPIGGSRNLTALAERIPGVDRNRTFQLTPEHTISAPVGTTLGERVGERVGNEIGAGLTGVAGLGIAARAGSQSSTALGRAFVDPLRRAPGRTTASELASAAGAGSAAGAAAEVGASSTEETLAAVGGSVAPATIGGAFGVVRNATQRGVQLVQDAFNIGDANRQERAASLVRSRTARLLREAANNPDEASYRLTSNKSRYGNQEVPDDPEFAIDAARAVPAVYAADDSGLESFALAVARQYPAVARAISNQSRELQRAINDLQVLETPGNSDAARRRIDDMVNSTVIRVQNDMTNIENSLKAAANSNPGEVASVLRSQIIAMKQHSKGLVQEAFENVDPDGTSQILTSTAKRAVMSITKDLPKATRLSSNEQRLYEVVERFGNVESFREMQALRQELRAAIESTPNDAEKRRLGDALRGVDDNIDQIATGKYPNGLKERYMFAKGLHRAVSRVYRTGKIANMRRQGVVGDIVSGEVPASATLNRMLHTGQASAEDAEQLRLALGGVVTADGKIRPGPISSENLGLLENYMVRMAYDATTNANGQIVPARYGKWRNSMKPVLDQFPQLRSKLDNVGKMVAQYDALGIEAKRNKTIAENRAVTTMIAGDPVASMDKVFRSTNRISEAGRLRKLVAGDVEAENGLKAAFVDYFHSVNQSGNIDSLGSTIYKADRMRAFLSKSETRSTMMALGFSGSEIGRMNRLVTLVDQYNRSVRAGSVATTLDSTDQTAVAGLTLNSLLSRFYAVSRALSRPALWHLKSAHELSAVSSIG